MSRRTINRCDACGTEHENIEPENGISGLGYNARWGHLGLGYSGVGGLLGSPVPMMYDLCEACVAKVIAMLGLKVPAPMTMQNDWPVPVGSYETCRPNTVRHTHLRPVPPLTAEDLKELGIDVDAYVASGYTVKIESVGTPSCGCHAEYKCIPATCEGHCDRCRQRALDRVKDIPLGDSETP